MTHPHFHEIYEALHALSRSIDAETHEQRELELKKAHTLICQCLEADQRALFALYGAVRIHEAWKDSIDRSEIGGLHVRFRERLPEIFPGAALVAGPKENPRHKPDAWVEFGGELMPVEIKRDFFGSDALQQLQRYMSAYECASGVAVAPSLRVSLPTSVRFFAVE